MQGFGQKLRELRLAKRMSQAELGDIVGVTRAAVQQWESGTTTPTLAKLTELARFFNASLSVLIGGPTEEDSVDAALRLLPEDIAMVLRQSFLNTIRSMLPLKK